MAKELEDELKVNNWLSVLTFDAFKYATAGGELVVSETDAGLALILPGVSLASDGINRRLLGILATEPEKETG